VHVCVLLCAYDCVYVCLYGVSATVRPTSLEECHRKHHLLIKERSKGHY